MNAIALLKEDHEQVMDIFDQLESLDDTEEDTTAATLFTQLKQALTKHTEIEEKVFYPALEEFDETRDRIEEAYREHQEVDQMLTDLSEKSEDDEDFLDRISELRDKVEHHVDEEENEIFPEAERLCEESQLEEMGQKMDQMKKGKSARASKRK
jgi:hemerythrin superfamily protein